MWAPGFTGGGKMSGRAERILIDGVFYGSLVAIASMTSFVVVWLYSLVGFPF